MSRRRYLSTDISTDSRINRLRGVAGDFAVVLYTWMIPHAEDRATIKADPEELLAIVCPLWRDKTPEDAERCLAAMTELELIWWDRERNVIAFPDSFYEHQTYIKDNRRRTTQDAAEQRSSSSFQENLGTSGKYSASFSFSSSSVLSNGATTASPDPPKHALPHNGAAQQMVAAYCALSGIEKPAAYEKAVGQAAKLVKAGVTVEQLPDLYQFVRKWSDGVDLGSLLGSVDKWREGRARAPTDSHDEQLRKNTEAAKREMRRLEGQT